MRFEAFSRLELKMLSEGKKPHQPSEQTSKILDPASSM